MLCKIIQYTVEVYKTCYNSLQQIDVNEIGLQLLGEDLSPFLKVGTTFVRSQSLGTEFVVKDCVKITCNIGAISKVHILRTIAGIPLGLGDLLLSKPCNKLTMPIMPSMEKEMSGKDIEGCRLTGARLVRSSLVKTE